MTVDECSALTLAVHQAALSPPLLYRTRGEDKMKNLVGQEKDREIAHQLRAKQTQLGDDYFN